MNTSLSIIRILQLVKGKRLSAMVTGFFETLTYILTLGYVFDDGGLRWESVAVYCVGFSVGNYLGSFMEEHMMKSYVMVELVFDENSDCDEKISELREKGFGVTVVNGQGKNGVKKIVKVICSRSKIQNVCDVSGPGNFTCVSDVKKCFGGVM